MKKPGDRWPFQTMRNSGDKGNASENLRGEKEGTAGKRLPRERRGGETAFFETATERSPMNDHFISLHVRTSSNASDKDKHFDDNSPRYVPSDSRNRNDVRVHARPRCDPFSSFLVETPFSFYRSRCIRSL